MKNLTKKIFYIACLSILICGNNASASIENKCISINPGSSKSANADSVLAGTLGANIGNFNFNVNKDEKLGCPTVTLKKISFVISNKNNIKISNIKLDISRNNPVSIPAVSIKNKIYFSFPENYDLKASESAHFSMYADVGKTNEKTNSGQIQVYYSGMEVSNTATKKIVFSPKPVNDDLKLLVLTKGDQEIFKTLSRIRNEVKSIDITGIKNYSFCIDEKNTVPKLENHTAKSAIDTKTNMCR